jgi:hypothetical protein
MATLNSGLGGPAGYGETAFSTVTLAAGNIDDGSLYVDLAPTMPGGLTIGGTTYSGLYVNSNGLITFDGPNPTPYGDLATLSEPAIAPFWADVDLSAGGEIYIDQKPVTGEVTITWANVQPYGGGPTNAFQVVITDAGGGDFELEFIYGNIGWTNHGGGNVAKAGFTDGNGAVHELDGSGDWSELQTCGADDFAGGDPNGTFATTYVDGYPPEAPALDLTIDGTVAGDLLTAGFDDAGNIIGDTPDNILAGAGDDTIDAGAGADTVDAGTGDDVIYTSGGTGGPISWTSVGANDNLTGTSGQDFYSWTAGNGSNATIRFNNSSAPGEGDGLPDYVRVETTNQTGTLTIGDFDMGTDRIVLQEMYTGISISMRAGYHDVTITYSGGNQQQFRIYTDGGDFDAGQVFTTTEPTTTGLRDDDSLMGGDGADTFIVGDGFGNDTLIGGEGGPDRDAIDLSRLSGPATITYDVTGQGGTITDGADTITFSEIEAITGTDAADVIDAADATTGVEIDGGDGADTVTGGSGDDVIDAGPGSDTVEGGAGATTPSRPGRLARSRPSCCWSSRMRADSPPTAAATAIPANISTPPPPALRAGPAAAAASNSTAPLTAS